MPLPLHGYSPTVLTGPLGGVLADRFARRRLMVLSDVGRVVLMLLMAVVVLAGLPITLLLLLAASSSLASAPFSTCVAATVPRLVRGEDLAAANATRAGLSEASTVLGPVVGAVLLVLGPPALAFMINAVNFGAAAALAASMPAGRLFIPARAKASGTVRADLTAGYKALRAYPVARRLATADVLESAVYGALTVLLLLLSQAMGAGNSGYGLLLAGYGAGGVLGALVSGRAMRRSAPRRICVAGLLATAAMLAVLGGLSTTSWLVLAIAALIVIGGAGIVVEVQADTALQTELPDQVFGRAYGLVLPACYAAIVAGAAAAPLLVSALGLRGGLVGFAALVAVNGLCLGRRPAMSDGPPQP